MAGEFQHEESGFGKRKFNRILDLIRKHRVLPIRPGWEQTPDGIVPPPTPEPGTSTSSKYWTLQRSTATPGNITINPGTILRDVSDLTATVTISNIATEITPVNTSVIFLEFTDADPTTCTIECETTWTDHPAAYEITGTGASSAFTAYRFPLYYCTSTQTSGYAAIGTTETPMYALRLVPDVCFRVSSTIYRGGVSEPALAVPVLLPYHRAIPT